MQIYRDYYKANGIRRLQEMMSPTLFNFDRLPRNAYYHNLTWDGSPDLDPSLTIFTSVSNRINVDLAETLTSDARHPIRLRTTARLLSMKFFRANKHFKYVPNAHSVTMDVNSPVVMNHNYLDHLYRYPAINIAPYYRWFNIEKTRWNTIDKICDESDRQHFVVIKLPKDLLAVSILKRFQDVVNVSMLKIFDTPEELFFLQMWKWLLITSRESTIFGNVKPKNLMKINLVIVNKRNQAVMINLGFLNSWIKLTVEEIKLVYHDQPPGMERDPLSIALQAGKQQLPPDMISKLWVRFCMTLQSNDIDDPLAEEPATEAPGLDTPEDQVEGSMQSETEREYETQNDIEGNDNAPDDLYSDLNKSKEKPKELFDKAKLDDLNAGFNDDRDLASRLKTFDKELEALEVISKQRLKEKGLMVDDGGEVVETTKASHTELSDEELLEQIHGVKTDTEALLSHVNTAAEVGMITAADYRKMVESVNNYAKAPEPYGSKIPMASFADVKPEEVQLDPAKTEMVIPKTVIDKTMANSSLNSFDPDYVNKILRRDIVAMVSATQRGGVIVRNHEVTIDHSVMGTYEIHRLELKPVNGQVSTIAIRIPKMQPDGTFMAAGNEYVLRKQRADAPIRKIDQLTVALTSYYGKTFVKRATRKSNSPVEWLIRKINLMGMEDHPLVKDVAPGNVFDNKLTAPYLYHALADNYRGFKVGKYVFDFSYNERLNLFSTPIDPQIVKQIESKNSVICGAVSGKDPIVMDMSDQLYIYRDKELVHIGDMYQVLQLDQRNAPVDFAEVSIFSKSVPVGVMLGYYIGFNNLIKYLKAKFRVVEGRKQKDLQADEYSITFKDRSYIFSRKDKKASLVLAGYLNYEKEIKAHEADQFNHRYVYFNLLDSKGLSAMYLREMEQLNQMFVDPITARILKSMNEPVTYRGLLLRSCELLLTYHHPDSQDMDQQRIRGTERIAGIIYKELVTSIRAFNNKNMSGKSKIEMSPYKVWSTIMNDQSGKITENINPIQQLKETEVITFVGEGGRAKEAMNRDSRAFHVNDTGIVSEATVDSSDVGINAYMPPNPNLANMYGVPKSSKEYNPANLLSTSALLAPGAYRDDGKRVNFIQIQQAHTIQAEGYRRPYLGTGYEEVIAQRTSAMFAYSAKQDGKVISITPKGVIVEYEDKTQVGVKLGRLFGKAEGSVYPHDVETLMKPGQKFKKGDIIAYNTGFFEPNYYNPTQVVMKNSLVARVALLESNKTHEDASSISQNLIDKLATKSTKVKSISIDFAQEIHDVVKIGQTVDHNTVLMVIEDEITSGANVFTEDSLALLKKQSNQAPKAKYAGTIDHIEVYYNGDKDEMSPSLRQLVNQSDNRLKQVCVDTGEPVITGKVTSDYRVNGVPLIDGKAEIKVYITVRSPMGVGDKCVFASQEKSVVGEVMPNKITTESGLEIDALFGYRSVLARIVPSVVMMGTTITCLKKIAENAIKLYKS